MGDRYEEAQRQERQRHYADVFGAQPEVRSRRHPDDRREIPEVSRLGRFDNRKKKRVSVDNDVDITQYEEQKALAYWRGRDKIPKYGKATNIDINDPEEVAMRRMFWRSVKRNQRNWVYGETETPNKGFCKKNPTECVRVKDIRPSTDEKETKTRLYGRKGEYPEAERKGRPKSKWVQGRFEGWIGEGLSEETDERREQRAGEMDTEYEYEKTPETYLEGEEDRYGGRHTRLGMLRSGKMDIEGEPYHYSMDEGSLPDYLKKQQYQDVNPMWLKYMYFGGRIPTNKREKYWGIKDFIERLERLLPELYKPIITEYREGGKRMRKTIELLGREDLIEEYVPEERVVEEAHTAVGIAGLRYEQPHRSMIRGARWKTLSTIYKSKKGSWFNGILPLLCKRFFDEEGKEDNNCVDNIIPLGLGKKGWSMTISQDEWTDAEKEEIGDLIELPPPKQLNLGSAGFGGRISLDELTFSGRGRGWLREHYVEDYAPYEEGLGGRQFERSEAEARAHGSTPKNWERITDEQVKLIGRWLAQRIQIQHINKLRREKQMREVDENAPPTESFVGITDTPPEGYFE